jgi:acetyl-CoA acetyltransferase
MAVEGELHHRDRCAIVGIGETDYSRRSGRSVLTLMTEAALAAIDDAGLAPRDIDGIVRCDMDTVLHNDLAHTLGIRDLTYWSEVGPGGVAPCAMVGQAVGAILSGQARSVLVVRGLNGRSGRRFGLAAGDGHEHEHERRVGGSGSYDEFFGPYGMLTPGQIFAMMARRHAIDFGTTAEQLAHISLTCRARANTNPRAQMHDRPLTLEDCLSARMIAAPLRLYDFCLETDGACAVVVTGADRAADCRRPPVLIRAVAQASIPDPQPGLQFPVLMRESITELPARSVATTLYRRAGLGPGDVDVAQVYDCFTITVLLQLEDWGFCKKGEGGPFVAGGEIDVGGQIPINTGGGHLSEGYIHGMNHVVEGVRQMRGTSTSQVPGAEVCLVTSTPLPPGSGLMLRAA